MRGRFILVAVALAMAALPPTAAANGARVVGTEDGAVTIELATDDYALERVVRGGEPFVRVTAGTYGGTSDEGLPSLPVEGALVGLPFGAVPSIEIVSVETENLGPQRIEPVPRSEFQGDPDFPVEVRHYEPSVEFYSGRGVYPQGAVSLGFDTVLRHQHVAQLIFHPFQYSASTGELTLNKRIVVRVTFDADARAAGMRPASVSEPQWDGVLAGTVVNYAQARDWQARREPRHAMARASFRQDHEAYRLEVPETGMYRLDFADLAAEGLPGTLDVDTLAVYQRSYSDTMADPFVETPLPIVVVDENGNDVFDGDDYVLFYGLSFHDQFVINGYENRYGANNVYWFGWGTGLAARMTSRTAWLDEPGLTPPASFRDTLRSEKDVYYDSTPSSSFIDYYSWTSYTAYNDHYELPFRLYDLLPTGTAVLTARYQGMTGGTHRIDLSVENGASQENYVGAFVFTGEAYTMDNDIYTSAPVANSYFTEGLNYLIAVGSLGTMGSGANLDWFSWSYDREYRAHDDRLSFTNALQTGTQEFDVTGFSSDALMAFDVTHPFSPVMLTLHQNNIEQNGGTYDLVLQEVVPGFTRYEAATEDAFLSPEAVERREPANLYAQEADLIVVSYDGFAQTADALVERREQQGYAVAHARLSEVYDEFGGGLPGPQPLRNYFMYAYDAWERQPQFVLLIGDASEDTKQVLSTSSPNYMPTYLFPASDDKFAASDQWYVRTAGSPYLPLMFIGRLPAGGTGQLSNFIDKIGTYESYSYGDGWRNKDLFIADDAWSYISLESDYTLKPSEVDFTTISQELSDVAAASPAGIDTVNFFLRRYTDPYHGSTTSGDIFYAVQTADWVRNDGPRADLMGMLNSGAALVNFEGHGNRTQMTHEQLILATVQSSSNDIAALNNENKPFVFLGFSCELARFYDYREGTSIDCITEQMLQRDNGRGASATFACSDRAFIFTNVRLHRKIYEALFTDPTPEGDGIYHWPRWALGGTIAKGVIKYLTASGNPTGPQTYMLFGDPLMHIDMSPPRFEVTVDGVPHVSGDFLASSPEDVTIVADIIDEVEIDPSTISVEETDTGVVDHSDYTVVAIGDTVGEASRWYRLTYTTPVRDWSYDIRLSATDFTGARTNFTLHVAEGQRILIRDVANYPNPFSEDTNIIYLLNQGGAEVRIRIFTVGGRLIRVIRDAPGNLNYNQVSWDGRDEQGDEVASGIYLYVIDVKGEDGSTATTPVGRMARIAGARPVGDGGGRR